MKHKLIIIGLAIVFVLGLFIWYNIPVRFLSGADSEEIREIYIFNGNTGQGFIVNEPERIEAIVRNISASKFKRTEVALGKMGYKYELTFFFGNKSEELIINSPTTIRKGAFYYYNPTAYLGVSSIEWYERDAFMENITDMGYAPLSEIYRNYTIEQGKNDKCVVMKNGYISYGQEQFDDFLERKRTGKNAFLRVVKYYSENNMVFVFDVGFADGKYYVSYYDNGVHLVDTYTDMFMDNSGVNLPNSQQSKDLVYYLCNENATYHDIVVSGLSSQSDAYIKHFVIYKKEL